MDKKRSESGLLDNQIQRQKRELRDLKNEKSELEQTIRYLKQQKSYLIKENLDMRRRFDHTPRPAIRRVEHQRRRDHYTTSRGLPPR